MNKPIVGPRVAVGILVTLLILACGLPAEVRAEQAVPPAVPSRATAELSDPAELEAFIDGVIVVQREAKHIGGVTIAVVKDGQLFWAKGYGYADVEQHTPVDPATTLFRIGSVSKLFTWTAVMQLVEQGKLDLNADVNTYLDFRIPATYAEPITLIHLMTHTPGFEDRSIGIAARTPEKIVPNGQWLARNIPARVQRPGTFSAYSNYGAALAGYIVERQSGVPYDEYIEQNILRPLGMEHTTTRQPLPPNLAGDVSDGYRYSDGAYQKKDFELINPAPAGAISASATDMARFMIAHLQDGRYGEARILQEATAQRMHSRLFTQDERLNGWAYGFYEMSQNGQRVIGHGGDTIFFHSLLALLPEQNVGLFASYNSESGSMLPQALFSAFMDRYYPTPVEATTPPADFAQRAARFAGSYQLNRMSYTKVEKVMALLSSVSVRAADDGTLVVNSPLGTQRFVEAAPLVFHEVDGDDRLIWRADEQGNIQYAFLNSMPMMAVEKLAWYEAPPFHYALLAICLVLFVSLLIAAPVGFFVSRARKDVAPQPRLARVARWVLASLAVLGLLFVAGLFAMLEDLEGLMVGDTPWAAPLAGLSILLAALTAAAVVFAALAWRNRYWHVASRIHYTLVTLAAVAWIWFLNYWNLLGWRY